MTKGTVAVGRGCRERGQLFLSRDKERQFADLSAERGERGKKMKVNCVIEVKRNGKYIKEGEFTNRETVYKDLAISLIAKKINHCTYIKRIGRLNLYNGFEKITITYSNDVRRIYTIERN